METMDLTPRWQDVLPVMLAVIQNPDAPQESRTVMFQELGRMAQAADKAMALLEEVLTASAGAGQTSGSASI